jgi:hypothetical protein
MRAQVTIVGVLQTIGVLLATAVFACCSNQTGAPTEPVRVEVWRQGDIGSTLQLTDAIEQALRASPAFQKSTGQKPGTLVILVRDSIQAFEVGDRLQLTYQVEFQTETGSALGATTGACWRDALSVCADFVVKQAELAAAKIKHPPKRV